MRGGCLAPPPARDSSSPTPDMRVTDEGRRTSTVHYRCLELANSPGGRGLQFAEDEGAVPSNQVRKAPPPKRRADPEQLLGEARRRAYTPEEAGRLLGRIPLSWWDHVLVFLGTGLRLGELAGLRCRRVHLNRSVPVLQVVEVRYQAGGQFGSGFKGRPKSDAGIRGSYPSPRWWSSPSAGSSPTTPARRRLSLPARAAATGSPLARGRWAMSGAAAGSSRAGAAWSLRDRRQCFDSISDLGVWCRCVSAAAA
jgi:hypothetical protein